MAPRFVSPWVPTVEQIKAGRVRILAVDRKPGAKRARAILRDDEQRKTFISLLHYAGAELERVGVTFVVSLDELLALIETAKATHKSRSNEVSNVIHPRGEGVSPVQVSSAGSAGRTASCSADH